MTHRPSRRIFLLGILAAGALTDKVVVAGATGQRWSQATAAAWYAQQPWLVGGLVAGKTQTYFPWDSWQSPYGDRPLEIWHHDLLRADGAPHSLKEANLIRDLARQH